MNDLTETTALRAFHPDWTAVEASERLIDSRRPFIPDGAPGLPAPQIYDVSERACGRAR